ncbi:MAG: hypothetical protein EOO43_07590 [Flavobacterium sp.]|nr:MAG: hypothetical protein EOO43_07590 [Flavobacterium sp.]
MNKNQPAVKSISNSNEEHLFVKQRLKLLLNPTHTIDIPHGIGKITLRNRPLSLDEYKLGSSGTPEGEVLNVKTVITYIEHGEPVRLLDLIGVSYKVKVITGSRIVEGYLAKGVGKQSTLKSIMQYR